jgi:hypothetical protein
MRYFVADCAIIGLRAASLSPNARAGRVDAIESTASGAHAPTRHFVAGLVPWSASEPPGLSSDARVEHVAALETAGQQSLMIQSGSRSRVTEFLSQWQWLRLGTFD